MLKNIGKANRLLVSQKLIISNDDLHGIETDIDETLHYIFPKKFRSDIQTENLQRIIVESMGETLIIIDNKIRPEKKDRFNAYKDLLLLRTKHLLTEKLTHLGINIEVSSLYRFDGKISYILGAHSPNQPVSQLWVEKETFRPLRLIINENVSQYLDFRYYNWRQTGKIWYPMQIDFYQNDKLIRKIMVGDIDIDPSFTEDLFDIHRIQSNYQSDNSEIQSQTNQNEVNEVTKAIEEFKKLYE